MFPPDGSVTVAHSAFRWLEVFLDLEEPKSQRSPNSPVIPLTSVPVFGPLCNGNPSLASKGAWGSYNRAPQALNLLFLCQSPQVLLSIYGFAWGNRLGTSEFQKAEYPRNCPGRKGMHVSFSACFVRTTTRSLSEPGSPVKDPPR